MTCLEFKELTDRPLEDSTTLDRMKAYLHVHDCQYCAELADSWKQNAAPDEEVDPVLEAIVAHDRKLLEETP